MKGQSSTVMIMLVGSVFAVALLILVFTFLGGIEPPFHGFKLTQDLVLQASKDKTGLCFGWDKVPFQEGEAMAVSNFLKGADSITAETHSGLIKCSSTSCEVISDVQTAVSASCTYDAGFLRCKIFFGSKNCTPV